MIAAKVCEDLSSDRREHVCRRRMLTKACWVARPSSSTWRSVKFDLTE